MTQLETLASKYEKLKEDHVSLRTDNTRFQNEVRILQARSFRSLEDAHWMPMDASEIATKIYSLRKGIDTIAKSYATVEIQQTISQLSPEGLLGLKSDLACVASFKSDSSNEAKELMESRDSPRLCLAALVSYAVHKRVLQNPFFFAGTWLERDFKPPSFKEGEVHIHPDAATFLYEGWLGGCACNYTPVTLSLIAADRIQTMPKKQTPGDQTHYVFGIRGSTNMQKWRLHMRNKRGMILHALKSACWWN